MNSTRARVVGGALLAAVLPLSGCATATDPDRGAAVETSATVDTEAVAAESAASVQAAADDEVMRKMRVHTKKWNNTLSPIVAGYVDPNVDAGAWVKDAGPVFGVLEPEVRAMGELAIGLQNPTLRTSVLAIVKNYQAKLAAFTGLVNAVAAGDREGERAAQVKLKKATDRGQRLAADLGEEFGVDPIE